MQSRKYATFAGIFLGAMISAFILIPSVYGADTIFLIQKDGSAPISSCVESNGLVLAQNLTDLCDVVIINPMTNEILGYNGTHWINISTSADNTVCTNVGTGAQVYKDGECNFRTILGSPDISVTQQANTITIDFNGTAGGDTTTCNNVGGGVGLVCQDGNVDLKSLVEGSNIDITNGVDTITIAVTGITSESTACNNVGTGVQLCSGGNVNMDTLIAGTGISITDTTDDWTISNTAPDNTACTNLGTGLGVYKSGECDFNSLIAGTGVTITDTTDDLTFASQCANTGTGEAICESSNNINSLIAGSGIDITDTTGDLTISSETVTITKPDDEIVNNSAVLQNDDDLFFSVNSDSIYRVEMFLRYDLKATSDYKYTFTVPSGAIIRGSDIFSYPNGAVSSTEVNLASTRVLTVTSDQINMQHNSFFVITGGTSGTVQYQWAQNSQQANDTTLKAGSTFVVTEVV